jgi:hypothetical protein
MDNDVIPRWQQWESRLQAWLNQSENDLELKDTTPLDRIMLTVLTVKYQVSYQNINKDENEYDDKSENRTKRSHQSTKNNQKLDKESENTATVILSRTKLIEDEKNKKDSSYEDEVRCKLFNDMTGHLLTPQQMSNEISPEWQEFIQICDWHGLKFMYRFFKCLPPLVAKYVANTEAYQKLISEPTLISPVEKIDNRIYQARNDGEFFLSIDIISANFALLKYIQAIDAQTYPTWADFLSIFVGPRPCLLKSKKLRVRSLGLLPKYYKLEALWTQFTANIYQTMLLPCVAEKTEKAVCVALSGDEALFHLEEKNEQMALDLLRHTQQYISEIPIVTFHVQAYYLRTFRWKNQHTCFARVFIGPSAQPFDLKCVPNRDENYVQAYKDCQIALGL